MPGPGHEHSAAFERCLEHVKPDTPSGRDPDEFAHRVCYTSVGKAVVDWLEKQDEREYSAPSTAAPPASAKSPEKDEELAGIIKELLSDITGSDADIQATSSDLEPKDRPAGANETPSDGVSMTKGTSHIHLRHFQLIKASKKGKRWFEGWGSVEVKDKQGDIIPSDELEPLLPLLRKRYNRFFDSHTDLMLGEFTEFDIRDKEVEVSDDEGNVTKEMRSGLWFKGFFYEDYAFQKEAWEKFKNHEYGGFSLRGGATGMKMACADDACTNMLRVPTGVEIAAFSIVRSPANPEATPEKVNMMAKSADIRKQDECMAAINGAFDALLDVSTCVGEDFSISRETDTRNLSLTSSVKVEPVAESKSAIQDSTILSIRNELVKAIRNLPRQTPAHR